MPHRQTTLSWHAKDLWQQLSPLLPGLSVEVLARVDSTNTQLLERARLFGGRPDQPVTEPGALDPLAEFAGEQPTPYGRRNHDTQPCLLVAEHQTRGRGRQGRRWQSHAGASLTFSLALTLAPQDWSGLSLAVGVALAEALDPVAQNGGAAPRLGLKWPNDLWLIDAPGVGRKLGGVLIESVAVGAQRMVVVGVGLNVLPQETQDLASGYACLQELMPDASAPDALDRVALPLVQALRRFEREGFAALLPRYAERDLLRGQAVTTTAPAELNGTVEGVAADGALMLRAADGLHRITSGEVSVRLVGGAA